MIIRLRFSTCTTLDNPYQYSKSEAGNQCRNGRIGLGGYRDIKAGEVFTDYISPLDADQTVQFSAAHGSAVKPHNIKHVGHKKLATDKQQLHGTIQKHYASIDQAVSQNYDVVSKKMPEGGYKKKKAA